MTIKALQRFERTFCDCDLCRDTYCKGKPGQCAPADMDKIADAMGVRANPTRRTEWMYEHFQACEDGVNPQGNDDNRMICIRPRVKDGQCVFFDAERNKCKVWHCAPFECTRCKACDPDDGKKAMVACAKESCNVTSTLVWTSMKQREEKQS